MQKPTHGLLRPYRPVPFWFEPTLAVSSLVDQPAERSMQRRFSIELTEEEAATVWRVAELSGWPAAQIVRHLYRTNLFRLVVELDHQEWVKLDEGTGQPIPLDPAEQRARFREWAAVLLE